MAQRFIDLEENVGEVIAELDSFGKKVRDTGITRALNRTIASVNTEANRRIRSELNIKAKDVRKAITVRRARRGALDASISIEAKAAPIVAYGAKQTRKGVTVKVKRARGRKLLKSAFIATMKSGHRGVFQRRTEKRLPIDEIFSTSVADAVQNESTFRGIETVARTRFPIELASQLSLARSRR